MIKLKTLLIKETLSENVSSSFGRMMYRKLSINEGAILLNPQDKKLIYTYVKNMELIVGRYLEKNKCVDAKILLKFINDESKKLTEKLFPFEIIYTFFDTTSNAFYIENKITIVLSGACRWKIGLDKEHDKIIYKCYHVDFKKITPWLIHEFIHYIQDVRRKEKNGEYKLQPDWSSPNKYYRHGWERQAHAIEYLEKLRQEFNIKNPREFIYRLKKKGLLQNPELNKLKKTDYNSWKKIMKQAVMTAVADIK